jgi:hypothetical protein
MVSNSNAQPLAKRNARTTPLARADAANAVIS